MRDIKFQILFEVHNRDFTTRIAKHYTSLDRLTTGEDNFDYSAVKIIAKRQFAGLQDKNGVDIYEGDIVKSSGNNSLYFISFGLHSLTGFYFDEEGEEVSCTGFFCSRQGSYPDDIESLCNKSNIYLEVIGNIHQNPELLETK